MAADSRPIRVLQVVRPAVGGMKLHVLQLATGLRTHGIDCEIACPGDSEIVQPAMQAGLRVHPIPLKGPIHPIRDPECALVLRDIMRERPYDLVHAHGFKAGLVTRVAARIAGHRKVIMTVHNPVMYRRDISYLTKRRYAAVEAWLSKRTTRYIAVSEALRRELIDGFGISPRKVTTIYPGLDLTPFENLPPAVNARVPYGIPPDAMAFGLASRFAPRKGMEVLAQAAITVCQRNPKAWFVLGGDGPLFEPVRKLVRDAQLIDRILLPGHVADVPGLLAALDAYVSATEAEGLGLATVEAMAAGLPVISTRAGGTVEVVDEPTTGVLVEPRDVDALVDAIVKMARDAEGRAAMGAAGRERAKSLFGEERMLVRVAELYEEIA